MKKLTAILVSAGMRSTAYAKFALDHPDLLEIVAVAEPNDSRRDNIKNLHNLPDNMCFHDWSDMLALPKMADLVIIGTQDDMHFEPTMAAIEKKYDILLEKPISPSPEECVKVADAANKNGVKIVVCHVLRFTAIFKKIKWLISSGVIGDVMHINHTEAVGNVHQSHSFVRGNWRNSTESSPMILAKSCHDTDLLAWLIDRPCKKIQSFGSLTYFNHANRPEGAPDRCIDGCPHSDTCFYDAVKIYLEDEDNTWFRPVAAEKPNPTNADIEVALRNGPYGRCVFACDNDVVDHQTVNMEFEGGITAVFTMAAFNQGGRRIRIMGTKGELNADMGSDILSIYNFADGLTYEVNVYSPDVNPFVKKPSDNDGVGADGGSADGSGADDAELVDVSIRSGHGGGDEGIMFDLCSYINGEYEGDSICTIDVSARNHLISFAAEKSRVEGVIVDMEKYEDELLNG